MDRPIERKEIAVRHPLRALVLLVGLAAALVGCAATNYEQYPDSASYDDSDADYGYFYDALAPYGAWYEVDPYGWVWTPYDIPAGWRPYTDGQWISTAYGWTWLSDDPWGWATYHYGRWTWDSYYGWLWVPGNVWAPAWVAWRYGDGWIGWAPLPPEVGWNGYGLDYGSYNIEDISRYRWSFCDEKDFTQTRIRTVVVPRSRNVTLLKTTKDVTRYGSVNARPVEQGLTSDMLERDLKQKIRRYEVADAPGVGRDRAAVVRGNVVEMYRPMIQARAPKGERTLPNANNRPGEQQRLEERQKARAERQRNATTDGSEKERSEIQPPGRRMDQPNVQAPATGFKSPPESNASSGTKSKSGAGSQPVPDRDVPDAQQRAETESQNAKWQAEAQREAEAQRQAAEKRDLDARIKAQRQELKQEQQKDIKNPPPGVSREELKERHDEEQQSQKEVEKRDREELKNREELRKQWEQAHEQARQQQKQGKEQGKEQEKEAKEKEDRGQSRQR